MQKDMGQDYGTTNDPGYGPQHSKNTMHNIRLPAGKPTGPIPSSPLGGGGGGCVDQQANIWPSLEVNRESKNSRIKGSWCPEGYIHASRRGCEVVLPVESVMCHHFASRGWLVLPPCFAMLRPAPQIHHLGPPFEYDGKQ